MGRRGADASAAPVLSLAPDGQERRIGTGLPGVDRVLGGGLVPGSVVLLAGAPGIGKSTLLLQLASRLSGAGHPCLLASGEETRGQVAERAARLGVGEAALGFVPGRDLEQVVTSAQSERPAVLVVDSIQTIRTSALDGLPGGPSQVRACADALVGLAKEWGVTVLLVGHVTKDGDLAGPRTLEHVVDVVLSFEADRGAGLRILAGGKNRYGPEGEVAWLEMRAGGLAEVQPSSRIGDGEAEPGCAPALAMAGRRGLAVDVQALVVPTAGPPRRQVSGLDPRRFNILAAVTGRAMNMDLARAELYGAAAGGLRLDDPGVDLAVAVALASAGKGWLVRPGLGLVGEVSLTGALRPVGGMEQRLSAAVAAGLEEVMIPRGSHRPKVSTSLALREAPHLREALSSGLARD